MADTKLSALTQLATLTDDDELYGVDDPDGTPVSRAVKASVVKTYVSESSIAKATRQSTVQSIPDDTATVVIFDTEVWDTDGIVDVAGANPSRLTVQTAGKYAIKAGVRFAADATGDRIIQIFKNGTTVISESGTNAMGKVTVPTTLVCAVDDSASVSDYYEVRVFQFSGGSLNIEADQRNFLSIHR